MEVLITGAGGFIGSHLVDSPLTQGHDVRAADLHPLTAFNIKREITIWKHFSGTSRIKIY